ncbi:hypothetical protein AZE42_03767 [Rhizopogon vesiculosus]|uniref:Protein Zds1 C-terminal domain-containing protein n=1 Tax=Rhizopogon vesiculosus TaxID=180088 RepID=A0A1J8QJ13_9AGAM|nr:hypothetical protein AZE42_03767 [Rhizopogon vesiculosus]
MQPSQLEIQREVEALRDIRRRSTAQGGPGALIIDPDLPNTSSPTSPTSSYWSATTAQQLPDGDCASGSHEDSSTSEERTTGQDDPFHLFWVPARLHPEIAPKEFRAFLKEHSRTPPPPDVAAGPVRSSSLTAPSTGLGRKRSMLSRQYKPSEHDNVEDEDEKVVPLRRNRTLLTNTGPQLTISDLQRLEALAEEASTSDDPTKLRNVLRRSLSLNVSPSAMDKMDNMPDMPDEADAPIIVPPPGLILRRAARTKIRKSSLPGDGGGHRFGSGRRTRAAPQPEPRTSSDLSSNDHLSSSDHGDSTTETVRRPRAFSTESMTSDGHDVSQTDTLIDEAFIIDAYLCDDPDDEAPSTSLITSKPPMLSLSLPQDEPPPTQVETVEASTPVLVLHHPQPQRLTVSPPSEEPSRTPSPDASTLASSTEGSAAPSIAASGIRQKTSNSILKKEKDRKGLFKWGSDKGGKKNGKDKEREKEVQRVEKEKEKEGGFFGSLFSSKKKSDEQASQPHQYGSGREAATALLGQSKSSKQYVPSPSPQLPSVQGAYARYPIHVERAIYRLSHIKLANPRRPLYEQVLISNLMFWYLGVINKTQNPAATPAPQNQPMAAASNSDSEQRERESESQDAEERLRAENDRLEREREIERDRELQLQQQQQQQQQQQKKESPRRGALTKTPSGSQGARRVAEMPIKGPQYEMQHREMEQQYNGSSYGYGSPSPVPLGGGPPRMQRQPGPSVHAPQIVQPQPTSYMYPGYSGPGATDQQQLPPDTIQPTEWTSSSTSGAPPLPRTQSSSSPPPNHSPTPASPQQVPPRAPHRSRSPPAQNHDRYSPNVPPVPNHVQATRSATRSLSATAVSSPPPLADGKARKVTSAHAVIPSSHNRRPRAHVETASPPRTERGEEEDVPLAVWKQQRRK